MRDRLARLRMRWRRLLRAYSRVFSVCTDKHVGVTPLLGAYGQAERDGVLSFDDGEIE